MNAPFDPPSKGMAMIASYRAARLSQRPVLRAGLRQSKIALRHGREGRPTQAEPAPQAPPAPLSPEAVASGEIGAASVFAGLVSLAVAERESGAAAVEIQVALASPMTVTPPPAAAELQAARQIVSPEPAVLTTEDPVAPNVSGATMAAPETSAPEKPAEKPHGPPHDPPLAEIGFGPGMLIRLSQLGLHTIGDLAGADAAQLRVSLGDISRLVDVETWVNSARQTAAGRQS